MILHDCYLHVQNVAACGGENFDVMHARHSSVAGRLACPIFSSRLLNSKVTSTHGDVLMLEGGIRSLLELNRSELEGRERHS
jgi:hypothetical protein